MSEVLYVFDPVRVEGEQCLQSDREGGALITLCVWCVCVCVCVVCVCGVCVCGGCVCVCGGGGRILYIQYPTLQTI